MPVLVLSDIHANLEAFRAVLGDTPPFDAVWFLGDAVGYGPDPDAVVALLATLEPEFWLAGNHDDAALGRMPLADFNSDARRAAEWTTGHLGAAARARLASTTSRLDQPERGVTLVHGSPRHPTWEYILGARIALENFAAFDTPLCVFGHTHVPVIYQEELDGSLRRGTEIEARLVPDGARWLVNPGSVGQPRDGDPRASYLLFEPDTGAVTFRRVAYDIAAVQEKILAAGLPSRLAARLDYGS